jgi:hypothetical protein
MGGMQVFAGGSSDDDAQTPCCDLRHACISTCGASKSFCDEDFLKCTKATCEAMNDAEERKKCDSSAGIHDLMIKMDQCQKYDAEQYSHCECVPKEDAIMKREKVLRAFYKKFNPDNVDKVAALAKKADNPKKMAGLLLKLYKKYPSVITKVKDPQQQMMEDMMKKGVPSTKDEGDDEEEEESDADDLGVDEL